MNADDDGRLSSGDSGGEPLRIGYLINQYPKPSHTFIRTEMRELERQGHHVARLAIRGWKDRPNSDLDRDERAATTYILKAGLLSVFATAIIEVLRSPMNFARATSYAIRLGRGSQAGLLKHLIYLLEACWTARWARRRDIRHLHAHFGTNTATVAAIVSKLSRVPFSFTVHGPEEFDAPRQLKLREKADEAAFVVAITSFCRSQLYRWVDPKHWSKIKIVHCTPDPAFLTVEGISAPERMRLVCVGRLCEQKGQLKLIEAVRIVREQGFDVHLTLAGGGEMRSDIEVAIKETNLDDRVTITGWINSERVQEEILASDALVLPSFAEGLPVVIMEAMALGRPVISTIIAGIPELVRDGLDGLLVPAGDSERLAKVIAHFLTMTEEQRRQLAVSGRERIRTLHNPRREAARLAELIRTHDLEAAT